jgi:hypothetical protein
MSDFPSVFILIFEEIPEEVPRACAVQKMRKLEKLMS